MAKRNCAVIMAATMAFVFCLFGCAPQPNVDSSEGEQADQAMKLQITWSVDSDCGVCHAVENSSLQDESCLASIHQAEGLACIDCHDDVDTLSVVHADLTEESMDGTKRLKKTSVDNCESCHDKAELAEVTASSAALVDSEGRTANPHSLPSTEGHEEFGAACTECHDMHASQADPNEDAEKFCLSCHHAGVYECHTCHE